MKIPGGASGAGWKVSLDDYLNFAESENKSDFSVDFINQMIQLNGFVKIYKKPKIVLVEAVESIELMSASRRTLFEHIVPSSFLTLTEANVDLGSLKWLDCSGCSVMSIETMDLKNEKQPWCSDMVLCENEDDDVPSVPVKRQRTKIRSKVRRLDDIGLGNAVALGNYGYY